MPIGLSFDLGVLLPHRSVMDQAQLDLVAAAHGPCGAGFGDTQRHLAPQD